MGGLIGLDFVYVSPHAFFLFSYSTIVSMGFTRDIRRNIKRLLMILMVVMLKSLEFPCGTKLACSESGYVWTLGERV